MKEEYEITIHPQQMVKVGELMNYGNHESRKTIPLSVKNLRITGAEGEIVLSGDVVRRQFTRVDLYNYVLHC